MIPTWQRFIYGTLFLFPVWIVPAVDLVHYLERHLRWIR